MSIRIRLVALLIMVAGLIFVGVHVATAGPPPSSWEKDNPAHCPFPYEDRTPPQCDFGNLTSKTPY